MIMHDVRVNRLLALSIRVEAVEYPHPLSGGVFRYDAAGQTSELAGSFSTASPEVPMGSANDSVQRAVLVAGEVLPMANPVDTPYVVRIQVKQAEQVVYESNPDDGGKGNIKDASVSFAHLIRIVAQ